MVRRWRHVFLLLMGVLLCTTLANAQEKADDVEQPLGNAQEKTDSEQRRIREVRIDIGPIYSDEEAKESSWARFANRWHIETRESVIRNEILFKEGDLLDEELLKQSERKLRRFQFLNKTDVVVVPVDEQTVDVEVNTKDAWSLVPGFNIKGGGDLYTVSADLTEVNLLGHGKKLYAQANYETDVGNTWKFSYQDKQLFNSRWRGNATYKTGPLIESFYVSAKRPLYSIDTKWAYGLSAYTADQTIRLFEEGEESSRFTKEQTYFNGNLKRSFGPRYQKTTVKLGLKYLKADYSPLGSETTTPPPPDQANLTPSVQVTKENVKWVKNTYINKMGPTEDDWLGVRYGGLLGYGIPVENGFELWDVRANVTKNIGMTHQQFLYMHAQVDSEVVRNTTVYLNARYYKKFARHTVATRFLTKLGYKLDSSRQFTLGADSGLRGYPARQFTGEKMVLLNLEDRQFWGDIMIGPKLDIGTVVFVDAGNVWKDEEEIDVDDLNWSAGFGFRIGFSNLPHQPIFRLDFGWALGDADSFAVTVGTEQQF